MIPLGNVAYGQFGYWIQLVIKALRSMFRAKAFDKLGNPKDPFLFSLNHSRCNRAGGHNNHKRCHRSLDWTNFEIETQQKEKWLNCNGCGWKSILEEVKLPRVPRNQTSLYLSWPGCSNNAVSCHSYL